MISYISHHTSEYLIAVSVLGFAVAIKRNLPTWSLVVPAIALAGGIVKKVVDCFAANPISSKLKTATKKDKQDSFMLAFLTNRFLNKKTDASELQKKGNEFYKNAIQALADFMKPEGSCVTLFDILNKTSLLDPKIQFIKKFSSMKNPEITNLRKLVKKFTSYFDSNSDIGAILHISSSLSYAIYYDGKNLELYNPENNEVETFTSDQNLIYSLVPKVISVSEKKLSFQLDIFTKKPDKKGPSKGKLEAEPAPGALDLTAFDAAKAAEQAKAAASSPVSKDLSGAELTKTEVELVKALLKDPNWEKKINPKLQECFSKFGIDKNDIRKIWEKFPRELNKRLSALSQKVDIRYRKYFLDNKVLKDYARTIQLAISNEHYSNSTDKGTTNKIFRAFQTFNIPMSIIDQAWSAHPEGKEKRLILLCKKVSKEDQVYFKDPTTTQIFKILDSAALIQKALSDPKYWQDDISRDDFEVITEALKTFQLDYSIFKAAWDDGKKTKFSSLLYENIQVEDAEFFTE